MQFSIIVPAFNVASFIDACVGGIRGQTGVEFEMILVDDGSTDGTGARCDVHAAADPRVR